MSRQQQRWRIADNSLAILEQIYQLDRFPAQNTRNELATTLNVSSRQIQVWFQNRRQRDRKLEEKNKSAAAVRSATSSPPVVDQALRTAAAPPTPPEKHALSISRGNPICQADSCETLIVGEGGVPRGTPDWGCGVSDVAMPDAPRGNGCKEEPPPAKEFGLDVARTPLTSDTIALPPLSAASVSELQRQIDENDKKLPNIHAGVPAAALLSPAPTVSAPASREGSAPSAPSSPSKAGGDSVAPLAGAPPVPLQRPPLVPLLPSNGEAGPSNGEAGGWPEHMAPRGVYSGGYSPVRLLAEASSSHVDGISAARAAAESCQTLEEHCRSAIAAIASALGQLPASGEADDDQAKEGSGGGEGGAGRSQLDRLPPSMTRAILGTTLDLGGLPMMHTLISRGRAAAVPPRLPMPLGMHAPQPHVAAPTRPPPMPHGSLSQPGSNSIDLEEQLTALDALGAIPDLGLLDCMMDAEQLLHLQE